MLFVYPMWESESQRAGTRRCSRLGYSLRVAAAALGFAGLLLLLVGIVFIAYRAAAGGFDERLLWLVGVPLSLGAAAEVLFRVSRRLVAAKGFVYDHDGRVCRWVEHGERVTYEWEPAGQGTADDRGGGPPIGR